MRYIILIVIICYFVNYILNIKISELMFVEILVLFFIILITGRLNDLEKDNNELKERIKNLER
jgi:hypothetical protein